MTALSDDERMLLKVLAGLPGQFDIYGMLDAALPPKPSGPRRRGRKRWGTQWMAVMGCWNALKEADMVWIVGTDPETCGNLFEVTDVGREALAGTRERT